MAVIHFAVASRSICWIEVGKHTVTRPIRFSKRLCCMYSSTGAIANFSRGQDRTATCHRFILIRQISRTHSVQISHWQDRAVVRRRSKICPKNESAAYSTQQRSFVCDKRQRAFATRLTVVDATRCFSRTWLLHSVTKKTSFLLH